MHPTDTANPDYFHKIVDCQWACPAHTNVPEYIRLIAQGRFTDAYMLNRESNVFPAILGRTCDRPCEPACRRGRLDGKPVAICRLKRVAADHRGEITDLLPPIPAKKNGRRIGIVGGGPGNLPGFRFPPKVLHEETGTILNMGVDIRYNTPVKSMKALLAEKFDAIFIG